MEKLRAEQSQLPPPDQRPAPGGAGGGQVSQQLAGPARHVLKLHLPSHHHEQQQEVHQARLTQILHLLSRELGVDSGGGVEKGGGGKGLQRRDGGTDRRRVLDVSDNRLC